jgi:NADPH2:quinone reductase
MKQVVVREFGDTSRLQMVEAPRPEPGPGEVLVKLECSGVNFIDVYMRSGIYKKSDTYKTDLPLSLGMEGGGRVVGLGDGVTGWSAGDRAAYCLHRGSYSEYASVPAWKLVKIPDSFEMKSAVALMLQGSTAHYLCHSAYPVQRGDWCLVHAAAGGVGRLLTQLVSMRGGRVIATVGTPQKARIALSQGAESAILYREEDFLPRCRDLTGGEGLAVVFDSVGADTIHRSIRSLRKRGSCILFGASSGVVHAIDPLELAEAGSVWFTRPHLADYMRNSSEISERASELFAAAAAGKLEVSIDSTFPLDRIAEAHDRLEGRHTTGKIIVSID